MAKIIKSLDPKLKAAKTASQSLQEQRVYFFKEKDYAQVLLKKDYCDFVWFWCGAIGMKNDLRFA